MQLEIITEVPFGSFISIDDLIGDSMPNELVTKVLNKRI